MTDQTSQQENTKRTRKKKLPGEIDIEEIKQLQADIDTQPYTEDDLVPLGSTMLNLACSGYASGGYKKGSINTLCGISDIGKTFVAMSALTATAARKSFNEFDLVMNNSESKGSFNIHNLFPDLEDRLIEPPGGMSSSIHQFAGSIVELCKSQRPFFCVLDSLDTLKADDDFEKSTAKSLLLADGDLTAIKEIKKTYGTEKAKMIKKVLGQINDMIKKTDSVLMIIQQLNQNMDKGMFGEAHKAAGGNAPKYYSTHRHWMVAGGPKLTKTVMGQKLEVGTSAKITCRKNHLNGKKRDVWFNIYDEYGIDDIESMCLFLAQSRWSSVGDDAKKAKSITASTKISAVEFCDKQLSFKDLCNLLWEDPQANVPKLRDITQETWDAREAVLHTGRKRIFV